MRTLLFCNLRLRIFHIVKISDVYVISNVYIISNSTESHALGGICLPVRRNCEKIYMRYLSFNDIENREIPPLQSVYCVCH